MSKVLSISIAAYNMEAYIRESLESCVIDGVMEDIEVIVVNDGSRDNTSAIAQEFEQEYPETFKVIDKENGGYGSTINASLKVATGKYFKLLDGDDWLEKEGLLNLVYFLRESQMDVVVCPYYKVQNRNMLEKVSYPNVTNHQRTEVSKLNQDYLLSNPAITFRTELIRKSGLVLPEKMLYTDQYYCTIPFSEVSTVEFLEYPVYCYRLDRAEQSVSKNSRMNNVDTALKICFDLCEYAETMKNNKNYRYIMYRVCAYYAAAIRTLLLFPVSTDTLKRIKECERLVSNISKDIYDNVIQIGRVGKIIKVLRTTGYVSYWGMKIFEKKMKSWA